MRLPPWRRPGAAWGALALAFLVGSALMYGLAATALDWQPGLAASEPWRAFSAPFVHYSAMHLWGNVAGLALTAALGVAARAPARLALAWLVAWPLAQLGLLVQPAIAHYGGMSGVVHAGVPIICVHLLFKGHRVLGGAMLAGEVVKVLGESPWGEPMRQLEGWDIAIVPLVHASGLLAGITCGVVTEGLAWLRRRPADSGA